MFVISRYDIGSMKVYKQRKYVFRDVMKKSPVAPLLFYVLVGSRWPHLIKIYCKLEVISKYENGQKQTH